ncbi:MAG: DNA primase [Calditrichia bacterium]
MAGIPEHIIDQIRDSSNIVDVVGRYVSLKKRGRNFIGLCPFHNEKTPSFNVNPDRQIFHCFGCGVGGNVYRFLMMHESMGFVDAVKQLAQESGIEIPVTDEVRQQESESERLYRSNEIATRFFQHHLQHAPKSLLNYLAKRGISGESLKKFEIGYAPEGWDNLRKYLEKGNYPIALYEKLGLLLKSEKNGNLYDRFRQRLMFPIHNPAGKVVGFGGRQLVDEKNSPKYINSPESQIYQKSNVLYGLNFAREAIREHGFAIFVEGYMDVIQLMQSGIQNVVATSGTALTEAHARLIRRYAQRVVLCYDADNAGINAAARGGEILFQNNVETDVLILPQGEDPDSYTRQNGADAFLNLLKSASDYFTFRLKLLADNKNLQNARERSEAVNELLDVLAPMQDAIRASFYLEKITENWQIPANVLMTELDKKQAAIQRRERFGSLQNEPQMPSPPDESPKTKRNAPLVLSGAWGGEKDILLLLLTYFIDLHEFVFSHLEPSDFLNPEFRRVFEIIKSQPPEVGENVLHHVLDQIENEEMRSLLVKEMFENNKEFQKPVLYVQGCIKQIKIEGYRSKIDVAKRRLKEIKPDNPEYFTILAEMQEAMNGMKTWQNVVPSDEG